MRLCRLVLALLAAVLVMGASGASAQSIILQSTTSTANSGLLDAILPAFKKATGIKVHVVAVGTGQAIRNARNCDGDVLLVHARAAEDAFVASGHGIRRHDVMYNDFIIAGPPTDPAGIANAPSAVDAFRRIAGAKALFTSRGDDSGTHKKELSLWRSAGIDTKQSSGQWYRELGSGMGATLNVAVGMGAYVMTDRATWITFANKADFRILHEGDPKLFNQYGVIAVNPAKCPNVKGAESASFVDWLTGPQGQTVISDYRVDGQQLFFPNAR